MPQNKKNVQANASPADAPKIRERTPPPGFAGATAASVESPMVVPTEDAAADIGHECATPDYQVGYKNPPLHSRFQKGQSGNPKGSPRGAKSLPTIIRELLGAKIPVQTAQGPRKISRIEGFMMKRAELAAKGDHRALDAMIRMWADHGPQEEKVDAAERDAALTETDAAMLEVLKEMYRAEFAQEQAGSGPVEDEDAEEEDRDSVEDDTEEADEIDEEEIEDDDDA